MHFARLVKNADGSFSWWSRSHANSDEREVAKIRPFNGFWEITWPYGFSWPQGPWIGLERGFESADDACLAAEKCWPPDYGCDGAWIETKTRDYFRKMGKKLVLHVRQINSRWYAVRNDGKVLGKGSAMAWFATAEDACRAVEQELNTLVDADPFRDTNDRWCWIKPKDNKRAA